MQKIRNELQVALLYDTRDAVDVRLLLENFLKIEENERGARYNVIESTGATFARCFGLNNDVMVVVERMDQRANTALFQAALGSAYNAMMTPDMEQRVDKHRSILLINVHHGALPPSLLAQEGIAELLGRIDLPGQGQTVLEFRERLRVLGLLVEMAVEISKPTLSHWTHSEVLIDPEKAHGFLRDDGPSPLHVHPFLYRPEGLTPESGIAAFTTIGARNFIGGEIDMAPSPVPWPETFQHALGFIRLALIDKGYVIPDGNTFGDEDDTFCYHVRHCGLNDAGIKTFHLTPMLHRESGFQSADFIPRDVALDLDRPQPELFNARTRAGQATVAEWRRQRATAQQAGGSFIVKVDPATVRPEPTPPSMFGRILSQLKPAAKAQPASPTPAVAAPPVAAPPAAQAPSLRDLFKPKILLALLAAWLALNLIGRLLS